MDKTKTNNQEEKLLSDNDLLIPPKPQFRLITGGKPPSGEDWLSQLPKNTVFLSQNSSMRNGILDMWAVVNKHEKAVLLHSELNQEIYAWVVPPEFCKTNELFSILEVGIEDHDQLSNDC